MGMMVASLQERGNYPVSQISLKKTLKGIGEKLQEDALKSDNGFDPDQELCHGLCQAQS